MISRMHVLGSGLGFTYWEADDPVAASKEAHAWSDLIDLKVYPAVDPGRGFWRIIDSAFQPSLHRASLDLLQVRR